MGESHGGRAAVATVLAFSIGIMLGWSFGPGAELVAPDTATVGVGSRGGDGQGRWWSPSVETAAIVATAASVVALAAAVHRALRGAAATHAESHSALRRAIRLDLASALVACTALGYAWIALHCDRIHDDDLRRTLGVHAAGAGGESGAIAAAPRAPLRIVRGMVLDAPTLAPRRSPLARFDPRPPRWRFRLAVTAITTTGAGGGADHGAMSTARGVLWTSVSDPGAAALGDDLAGRWGMQAGAVGGAAESSRTASTPIRAGETLLIAGRVEPFEGPQNPGEFDARLWARAEGLAGALWVEDPALVERVVGEDDAPAAGRLSSTRSWLSSRLAALRAASREFGDQALERGLPTGVDPDIRSLLRAMFLGRRDAALAELESAFRRTGTMHLVAISGFNMAVLAAGATWCFTRIGGARRGHVLAVVIVILSYLAIVNAAPAVLRAGVMILVAAVAQALGRGWSRQGVIATSALLLLLIDPAQLFNAGFQLSFAVVAALAFLAPALRARCFGARTLHASTLTAYLRERGRDAIAAAGAAWIASTPITAWHFGIVSPLAAPLSLLLMPLATVLLLTGYLKMALTPLSPLLAVVSGVPVAALGSAFAGLVRGADGLPGAVVHVSAPGPIWCAFAATAMVVAVLGRSRRARRLGVAASLGAAAVLFWPMRPAWLGRGVPALRLDMLAVGDGTCIALRSGGQTVLFDAGSTSLSRGARTIVPALRALGVRSLDAIVVSHPNLDHYAAIPELIQEFEVGEVIVGESLLRAAGPLRGLALEPHTAETPVAATRAALHLAGVPLTLGRAGLERRFGDTTWEWLHPAEGFQARRINSTSQVIRVTIGARSLLLCGDIEEEAIAVLSSQSLPPCDILELPHHGSWRAAAGDLVEALEPAIVLQSTGPARLSRDAWATRLTRSTRLMTARDGALWVEIDRAGAMTNGALLWR